MIVTQLHGSRPKGFPIESIPTFCKISALQTRMSVSLEGFVSMHFIDRFDRFGIMGPSHVEDCKELREKDLFKVQGNL